jgi:streptogramin lyase
MLRSRWLQGVVARLSHSSHPSRQTVAKRRRRRHLTPRRAVETLEIRALLSSTNLVGVDFGVPPDLAPLNWTHDANSVSHTLSNLIDETGAATAIDLTVTGDGGGSGFAGFVPSSSQIPTHSNSLAEIAGNIGNSTGITFTFSDLNPGNPYRLYIFGGDGTSDVQSVTISGGGPLVSFTQTISDGQLFVNGVAGSNQDLETFAVTQTADDDGRIVIRVAEVTSGSNAVVPAIAIQQVVGTGPATISGTKFNDRDADGQRDAGEEGLSGWVVYADLNRDGDRDVDNPFAVTDDNGNYTLTVDAGSYLVREERQAGWRQTSPYPRLFATSFDGANGQFVVELDPVTGRAEVVGSPGFTSTYAAAFTPDGTLWTVTNAFTNGASQLARIDLNTGVATPVGAPDPSATGTLALEADAAGNLYAANLGNGNLYRVDTALGTFTLIGSAGTDVRDLDFDNTGVLWGSNFNNQLFTINTLTGARTVVTTITGVTGPVMSLMTDPLSGLLYASTWNSPTALYIVNRATGQATQVGPGLSPITQVVGGDFEPLSVDRGHLVTVAAGVNITRRDFGNQLIPPATITGTKFNDLDGDGQRDAGEAGLEGWMIYSDLDRDGVRDVDEPFAITDANGQYTLYVGAGTQLIREVSQAGWRQTSPAPRLYATAHDGRTLIQINPATGSASVIGPLGFNGTFATAFTPDGTLWTVTDAFTGGASQLARIDLVTGVATPIGTPNEFAFGTFALESDDAGNLYAASLGSGSLYRVDTVLGTFTLIGSIGTDIRDLDFDDTGVLWGSNFNNELFTINPLTGARTFVAMITGVSGPVMSLMTDPLSGLLYASTWDGPTALYIVDRVTGQATQVGPGMSPVNRIVGGDFEPFALNRGHLITTAAGMTFAGRDFGNQLIPPATVTGMKFNDLDGDGQLDAGESGLGGWIIYSDLDGDGLRDVDEPFATTDANGQYVLYVAAGSHLIREEQQAGWIQTSPTPRLYATANDGRALIQIDSTTGSASVIGPFGYQSTYAAAFTPDGTLWTIAQAFQGGAGQLARIDLASGVATLIGSPDPAATPSIALEADAAGNLYAANMGDRNLYRVDTTTGAFTLIGFIGTDVRDLDFDNDGVLWGTNFDNQLFTIDPQTGLRTLVTQVTGVSGPVMSLMTDPLTGVLYASLWNSPTALYTIDRVTGVATQVGPEFNPLQYVVGGDFEPLSVSRGHSVRLAAGDAASGKNFGNQLIPDSTVTGTKFNDLDGDGEFDANESGLEGWVIYADLNNDGDRDIDEPFTTTGADGRYTLTLDPGTYIIREEGQAGWRQTSPDGERLFVYRANPNTNSGTIYELNPTTGAVLNSFAAPPQSLGIGPQGLAVGPTSLFYLDTIQGATGGPTAALYELDLETGALIDTDLLLVNSGVAGLAYLNGRVYVELYSSNQVLVFDPATDSVVTTLNIAADTVGGLAAAPDLNLLFASNAQGQIFAIHPVTGAVVNTLNTGIGEGLTGGLAYVKGELLAAPFSPQGVIYRIDPTTGAILGTLIAGGTGPTTALGGDGVGFAFYKVVLATGRSVEGRDFGDQEIVDPGPGIVRGQVFDDANLNGQQDAGEAGIADRVVYADLNRDGDRDLDDPFVLTDANGFYELSLAPGDYQIRQELPPDWVQTSPTGQKLFVLRTEGSVATIYQVDPTNGQTINSFAAPPLAGGPGPQGLAVGPTSLFYLDSSNALPGSAPSFILYELSAETGAVLDADAITVNSPVAGLAWLNGRVYLELYASDEIAVFDPDTDVVTATLSIAADIVGGLTGAAELGLLFETNNLGQIISINPETGAVVNILNTGASGGFVGGLAYHNGELLAARYDSSGELTRIDPATGAILGTLTVGGMGVTSALGGEGIDFTFHAVSVVAGVETTGRDFGSAENLPPSLALEIVTPSVAENVVVPDSLLLADIVLLDNGLGTNEFSLSGADADLFEIIGSGLYLKAGTVFNYEARSTYSVTILVDDPSVGSSPDDSIDFTLQIADVNEAPTLLRLINRTTSLSENTLTASRIHIADLELTDDALGSETYELAGLDPEFFEIESGSLYLRAGVSLDFEAKPYYSLVVRADDPTVGAAPDVLTDFVLSLSDVNEAPTALALTNTTTSLAENSSTASRIQVAEIDVSDDALGSEILGLTGADSARFELDGNRLYLRSGTTLDFETQSRYDVRVTVDDVTVGGTPDASIDFSLFLTDVNEAPSAVVLANAVTTLSENASTSTRIRVADVQIVDDALGTNGLVLTGSDAGLFEVDSGVLYLRAGVRLDFESNSELSVVVSVDDAAVGGSPDAFTSLSIALTDFAEAATVIGGFSGSTSWQENAAAALLDTSVTVSDPDSPHFAFGVLTVRLAENGEAADRLFIRNVGIGAGQIGLSGTQVTFGGAVIGEVSGGEGTTPLSISLNAACTQAALQALIQNLTFRNVSEAPSTLVRRVELTVLGGDGMRSAAVSKTVTVTAVNDAPTIDAFGGTVQFVEAGSPVVLDGDASIGDVDSANLATGQLTVRISSNASADDRLTIRNEGTATGQVGVSGSNVTFGGIVVGTLAGGVGTSPLVITFNASATTTTATALLRNIQFTNVSVTPSTATRTLQATITDGDGGTSTTASKSVTLVAVNTAPTVSVGGSVSYVKGGAAVLVSPTGTLSDPDSANFNGGSLSIQIAGNSEPTDRLRIVHQGNSSGRIGVSGSNVSYGGTLIGTWTGGDGGTPLVVTFSTNSANPAAVQALLRDITFSSTSSNPSSLPRTLQVVLDDGDGASSAPAEKSIQILHNTAISNWSGSVAYTENAAPVLIDTSISVSDSDTSNFGGFVLTASLGASGHSSDRLSIRNQGTGSNQIAFNGTSIRFQGTLIGTASGGDGVNPLVITLNSAATQTALRNLIQNLTFANTSDAPPTNARTVTLLVTDAGGALNTPISKTVTVSLLNDAPVIGEFGGGTTYTRGGPAVLVDENATVTDVDGLDFSTGRLTVQLTNNAQSTDRLRIRNTGTAAGEIGVSGSNVTYGGVVIGTFVGGSGTTALVVTLNANAHEEAVEALLRNIEFTSTSFTPSLDTRTVRATLTDGDGGTSNIATKTINVT